MSTRIVKEYTDTGFGFPVIIKNVPMARIGEDEMALIDYKKLEKALIQAMPAKHARLSGAEIRFIRQHFGLTLQAFGGIFGVTHPAVKKWESCKEHPACMTIGTEKALRMWVQRRLSGSEHRFITLWDSLEDRTLSDADGPLALPYSRVSMPVRHSHAQ